jgi:hypothetical protein
MEDHTNVKGFNTALTPVPQDLPPNGQRPDMKSPDESGGSLPVPRRATGPRTRAGKERSKQNAQKHGIFSKTILLRGESRREFETVRDGLRADLRPVGTMEETLVEKLAVSLWRYRRLLTTETWEIRNDSEFGGLGGSIPSSISMDRLLRYEAMIERGFDRTLKQLERIQGVRLGQPVLPAIKLDISSSRN